ncbi:MAG TPA: hypothetical protein VLD39_05270, partial [Gammaproteobacteria bacterium]|nr:hypothetical protein [Gammaproteobacteria bacterium]
MFVFVDWRLALQIPVQGSKRGRAVVRMDERGPFIGAQAARQRVAFEDAPQILGIEHDIGLQVPVPQAFAAVFER